MHHQHPKSGRRAALQQERVDQQPVDLPTLCPLHPSSLQRLDRSFKAGGFGRVSIEVHIISIGSHDMSSLVEEGGNNDGDKQLESTGRHREFNEASMHIGNEKLNQNNMSSIHNVAGPQPNEGNGMTFQSALTASSSPLIQSTR